MQFFNVTQRLLNPLGYYLHKRYMNSAMSETIRNIQTGDKVSVMRTVTEEDVMNFAKLTNDFNPVHVMGKNKLVHGALLNGFLSGVLGTKLPGPGTLVIEQYINYPKPCYAGDTIEISIEVLSARKIIKCGYKVIVIDSDRIVLEGNGKFIANKIEIQ
ncbi:hypothetical protein PV327_005706 [Microctonus hyperodae]|uniref:MaoC-like domain-containing protein n=1 Tax=Microctonus hyperodae TaxID=165561 RepID=A0AA39G1Y0_MICHY|nr:hypothetical protein PV327_005706 [Microctonus hyperodae]